MLKFIKPRKILIFTKRRKEYGMKKTVVIIPNPLKEKSLEFAPVASKYLEEKGYNTEIITGRADGIKNAKFALVLGGDGTILRAARQLYGKNIPIFGINFGRLGYLTECGSEDAMDGLNKLISGEYSVEERMMLEGEIIRNGEAVASFISLNEVCAYRATLMHAISTKLYINGKHTETVSGDGLIVSTPTGSTSYNLSAGGPVLTPNSQNIVITPVASHGFSHPSIVTDGTDTASMEIIFGSSDDNGVAYLEVDGNERYELLSGDIVNVRRAKHKTKIIKATDKSFYQILREKLSYK